MSNPHEIAARAKKVAAFCAVIDAQSAAAGMRTRHSAFAHALAGMSSEWWRGIARAAGVNEPSETTRAACVEWFARRAREYDEIMREKHFDSEPE